MDFEVTVDIAAPPRTVWTVISDVERWPEWTPSITTIRRIDQGPFRVGSSADVKQPRLPRNRFQVTRLEEDRGFDWESRSPGLIGVGRHWIEPTAGGSRATLGVDFRGVLAPLIRLLYGSLTQRYIEMEAAGLKRRAEEGRG